MGTYLCWCDGEKWSNAKRVRATSSYSAAESWIEFFRGRYGNVRNEEKDYSPSDMEDFVINVLEVGCDFASQYNLQTVCIPVLIPSGNLTQMEEIPYRAKE